MTVPMEIPSMEEMGVIILEVEVKKASSAEWISSSVKFFSSTFSPIFLAKLMIFFLVIPGKIFCRGGVWMVLSLTMKKFA